MHFDESEDRSNARFYAVERSRTVYCQQEEVLISCEMVELIEHD